MKQLAIKYGVIAGAIYVIVGLVNLMYELSAQGGMMGVALWAVPFVLTFAVVYVAVKEFREENGSLTTGQGVKLGVTIGLIAAIIGSIVTIIYTQLIDPDVMARQLEMLVETWENQGMTDEQIEQAKGWTEPFMKPYFSVPFTIIWYVLGGLIKGAISGAVLKRETTI